jgi:hypothetical protein
VSILLRSSKRFLYSSYYGVPGRGGRFFGMPPAHVGIASPIPAPLLAHETSGINASSATRRAIMGTTFAMEINVCIAIGAN